jgi:hypothetical protein
VEVVLGFGGVVVWYVSPFVFEDGANDQVLFSRFDS